MVVQPRRVGNGQPPCYRAVMDDMDAAVARKKAELDRLRPVSRQGLANLSAWYDVELTYTSNAIEGNTLTRSETAIVLEKGITVSGKPLRDHMEAVGHQDALRYVRDLAGRDQPLRESDVRQIHALVLGRADPENAGCYADAQRLISGTSYRRPPPAQIRPMMGDFGQWLSKAAATAETAVTAHERVASIHPFSDGNGRTTRLLMNLVLLKGGYPPVVIGPEQRTDYIDGLQTLNQTGDALPYRQSMTDRLDSSLSFHLDVLGQGRETAPRPPRVPTPLAFQPDHMARGPMIQVVMGIRPYRHDPGRAALGKDDSIRIGPYQSLGRRYKLGTYCFSLGHGSLQVVARVFAGASPSAVRIRTRSPSTSASAREPPASPPPYWCGCPPATLRGTENRGPASVICLTTANRSKVNRASRSMRVTVTTPPASIPPNIHPYRSAPVAPRPAPRYRPGCLRRVLSPSSREKHS